MAWVRSEGGAALAECALVFPLTILLITGALELGRAFATLSGFSHDAYVAALAGAQAPPTQRGQVVLKSYQKLHAGNADHAENLTDFSVIQTSSTGSRTISIQPAAVLRPIGNIARIDFQRVSVAPQLLGDSASGSDFSAFANSEFAYNCEGNVIGKGEPSSSPCGSGHPSLVQSGDGLMDCSCEAELGTFADFSLDGECWSE